MAAPPLYSTSQPSCSWLLNYPLLESGPSSPSCIESESLRSRLLGKCICLKHTYYAARRHALPDRRREQPAAVQHARRGAVATGLTAAAHALQLARHVEAAEEAAAKAAETAEAAKAAKAAEAEKSKEEVAAPRPWIPFKALVVEQLNEQSRATGHSVIDDSKAIVATAGEDFKAGLASAGVDFKAGQTESARIIGLAIVSAAALLTPSLSIEFKWTFSALGLASAVYGQIRRALPAR